MPRPKASRSSGSASSRSSSTQASASVSSGPRKVCVGGFPRAPFGRVLEARGRSALANLTAAARGRAVVKGHKLRKSYSIAIADATHANDFIERARNDPRSNQAMPLRVGKGAAADMRRWNHVFGYLWKRVRTHLSGANQRAPNVHLGSQGVKGTLYLIQDDDARLLFYMEAGDHDQFTIAPNSADLERFGMTPDVISQWIQAAQ
ncbi:unnamed protein product [Prorocentrum cordatum]|uniref:Serine hydrolase n=1 Tax=Prorocentrum cordatum TaxID=2364126 RepID=A0ABN9SFN7_9DINO|nr:unnamed protein product [Polarella glacialis]